MSSRAIFLDRDGTIAKDVHYCRRVEDFEILPTVPEAIKLLNDNGFKIIVITNQSGVARGYFTKEMLAQIHQKMKDELGKYGARVDAIYYCPHHPDENCECRKPKTALFRRAVKEHDIDLGNSYMIGDMKMDIDAGNAMGCKTILVTTGPAVPALNHQYPDTPPDYTAASLLEAVRWIASNQKLVSAIIAAKDEAEHIGGLITMISENLDSYPCEVIVVDDGSRDKTSEVALKNRAVVITHERNLGKSAAMKTAVRNASGEIFVFLDGDGAHEPQDIPKVIAPILEGKADFVIGSRVLPQSRVNSRPLTRKLANTVASLIISATISFLLPLAILTNRMGKLLKLTRGNGATQLTKLKYIKITDCTSGFRAITREGWQSLALTSRKFEIETEMIYEAAKNGLVITEVPISCNWNKHLSRLSITRDGLKTLKLLSRKLIRDIRGSRT